MKAFFFHDELLEANYCFDVEKKSSAILLGYCIHNEYPEYSNKQLLQLILNRSHEKIDFSFIDRLGGRFVLILKNRKGNIILNDPCALRSVFCHKTDDCFYIASQPNIIKVHTPLRLKQAYVDFISPQFVLENKEYWLPGSACMFENVKRLLPNHYLDLKRFDFIRFWPTRPLAKTVLKEAKIKAFDCLRKSMKAVVNRYSLAISLTAGYDTRLILSAVKQHAKNHQYYSLIYDDVSENNADNIISEKIAKAYSLPYQKINCITNRDNALIEDHLNKYYLARVFLGEALAGLKNNFPKDLMAVKGDCPGISKNFYKSKKSNEEINLNDILSQEIQWHDATFLKDELSNWFKEVKKVSETYQYRILDLFYWEQRMPGWLAHGLLEWDEAMEVYSPFNQRAYHESILGIDKKHRTYPDFNLIKSMIGDHWPELLQWPLNPLTGTKAIKRKIRSVLSRVGVYENPFRKKL